MADQIYILVAIAAIMAACCYGRSYTISAWNVCHEASHLVLYNSLPDKCAWECAVRDSCVAVQYNRMEHSCGILTLKQLEAPLLTCRSHTYIRRTHITIEPESCEPYRQSSTDNSCITECNLTENLQHYAKVDQFPSAGSRIKIGCKPPLTLAGDQYLHCTDSGEFNSAVPTCQLPSGNNEFCTQFSGTNLALQKPTWQSSTLGGGTSGQSDLAVDGNTASTNLALRKPTWQSSTLGGGTSGKSDLAVDGNTASNWLRGSCSHTEAKHRLTEPGRPWWVVDLGAPLIIRTITVYNRRDCCGNRFADAYIYASTSNNLSNDQLSGTLCIGDVGPFSELVITLQCRQNVVGRYIKIILNQIVNPLTLCEVQIQGEAVLDSESSTQ